MSVISYAPTHEYHPRTLTNQAQDKLAAAQTEMERSMLNITYKDRKTNIWVNGEDKSHRYNQHCKTNEIVLGRAYQPPQRRPIYLTCHHLETIKMTRKDDKGDQPSDGETTWQILERHDMAEDSTKPGNLETAC